MPEDRHQTCLQILFNARFSACDDWRERPAFLSKPSVHSSFCVVSLWVFMPLCTAAQLSRQWAPRLQRRTTAVYRSTVKNLLLMHFDKLWKENESLQVNLVQKLDFLFLHQKPSKLSASTELRRSSSCVQWKQVLQFKDRALQRAGLKVKSKSN